MIAGRCACSAEARESSARILNSRSIAGGPSRLVAFVAMANAGGVARRGSIADEGTIRPMRLLAV